MTYFCIIRHQNPLKRSHAIRGATRSDLDPGLLADAVDRPGGNVAHQGVLHVQVDEHVVREAIAAVEAIEIETP